MLKRHVSSLILVVRSYGGRTVVDLRSDTMTKPTPAMRAAMASAVVGDDVFEEDPTIRELERRSASLLGLESGLFVPTGTMGNLLAIMSHCRERGSEIIVGAAQHIHRYEQGGYAQLAGVASWALPNEADGTMSLRGMRAAVRDRSDFHQPCTALVCLENTHNVAGGRILPDGYIPEVAEFAKSIGANVHLDGARLYNAAVSRNQSVADVVKGADSVSMCLSKGIGAPVGSVLVGADDMIKRARRHRKALGGGIRQGGVLAAAALVALDGAPETLAADHRHAQILAEGTSMPSASLNVVAYLLMNVPKPGLRKVEDERVGLAGPVETNIVMLKTTGIEAARLCHLLRESHGDSDPSVLCFPFGPQLLRWVTHNGVDEAAAAAAVAKLAATLAAL